MNLSCSICGEPHEQCSYLQITKHISDAVVPSRAKLTLPSSLQLQLLSDGSYTITAQELIEKGTKFGPLEAEKSISQIPSPFPLKSFTNDGDVFFNTTNENASNWMIFVIPAETEDEQNLICYQENGDIFYAAFKNIEPGAQLRVWYSPYYAQKMNTTILAAKNNPDNPLKNIDVNRLIKKQQKIMDRKNWTCKFCGQIENSVVTFGKHILQHYTNQLKKVCEICKSTFYSRHGLRAHLRVVHSTISPPKKSTPSNSTTTNREITFGGPLLNNIFSDSLDNSINLNQFDYNNLNHQNLSLDNDYDLSTENVKDLDHFNFEIDDNQKQFVCDICLKQFAKLTLLIRHLKHHTGDFICSKCLKVYCRNESLKNHICSFAQKFRCDICDKEFFQKKYLKRHLQSVHFEKFKCTHCNNCYYTNNELQEHNCSKINNKEKTKFICTLCNKIFFRLSYLKRHQKTHERKTMKKYVVCETCGVNVERNSYYLHKKIHLTSFLECDTCGKAFKRADVLKNHQKTHQSDGEKFECSTCKKQFKSKKTLKTHQQIHSNNVFKCPTCDLFFTRRSSLNFHIKKKHNDKNNGLFEYYTCPICDKKIVIKKSLHRHLKRIHSNVQIDIKNLKPKIMMHPINNNNKDDKKILEMKNDENNREICLSIPDLTENDQEITLDKNAYILENGTIIQPQNDSDEVIIYLLDQKLPNLDC